MQGNTPGAGSNAGPHLIVIALGQEFRQDDAAGIRAVETWLDHYPARRDDQKVQVEFAGLPGLNLLFLMEGFAAAILVDAMRSGAKPGTIKTVHVSDLASFSSSSATGHGWGAAETLQLGQQVMPEKMPVQLVLIGIEAGEVNDGLGLTAAVEAAIPVAAQAIEISVRAILQTSLLDTGDPFGA